MSSTIRALGRAAMVGCFCAGLRAAATAAGAEAAAEAAAEWTLPEISLPRGRGHPVVAATPEELARLREAWRSAWPERRVVASVVEAADRFLARPVEFPPRGGQHNQWYQCERCQLALVTVDPTHHRCRRCGTVYTGEPYDDVVFSSVHDRNLRGAQDCAWAWSIAGEEKHAARAREVLLGYAERYRSYPLHSAGRGDTARDLRAGGHLFEQTLTEAAALARSIAPAYDLIHDAPVISGADREAIRTGLLVPMLENIAKNEAGKSNWQTWHDAALLTAGAVLGEVDWVRKALADPRNGFAYQMGASVTEDGMWYENSWGYHFYTLDALILLAEGSRRLGIDLWGCPQLRRMFLLPLEYALPDGSLPRFGDDVQTTVEGATRRLDVLWHATRDPALRGFLPPGPTWESVLLGRDPAPPAPSPVLASKAFLAAGHAILRVPGADGTLAAAITFGPYGGFHGHLDKLSCVFFARGEELGVDPGRARSQAYRLPIHSEWYKATVGHNSVLVDGVSQEPAEGRLDLFGEGAGSSCAAVAASCDAAYPGVKHSRLLCLLPEGLLVVDRLDAEGARRFDWLWHNRGEAARCAAATEPGALDPQIRGGAWVDQVRVGEAASPIEVVFAGKRTDTRVLVAAGETVRAATGLGVGASVEDRVPMAAVTRRGGRATFAAAVEPVAAGSKSAIRAIVVEEDRPVLRVRMEGAAGEVRVAWSGRELTVARGGSTLLECR